MKSEVAVSVCLLLKEIRSISVRKVFEDKAEIEVPLDDNPFVVRVWLKPHGEYFKGTKIPFIIELPRNYPRRQPSVNCEITLYHPNVSNHTGHVCFSMFSSDWHESYRLEHFINGLLWLLDNPNFSDALNRNIIPNKYKKDVRKAVRGLLYLDGVQYASCINNELGEEELKQLEEEDQQIMNPTRKPFWMEPLKNIPIQPIAAFRFLTPSLRTPLATLIQQHTQRTTNSSCTITASTTPTPTTTPINPAVLSSQTRTNFTSTVDRSHLPSRQSVRQYFQTLSLNR